MSELEAFSEISFIYIDIPFYYSHVSSSYSSNSSPPFTPILPHFFLSHSSFPNCCCSELLVYLVKDADMKPPRPVSQRADCVGPDHMNSMTGHTALGQAHRGVSRGGHIDSPNIAARGLSLH